MNYKIMQMILITPKTFLLCLKEGALERLYRWAQSYCRYIDNPELSELLIKAMARLQDRPVLFK